MWEMNGCVVHSGSVAGDKVQVQFSQNENTFVCFMVLINLKLNQLNAY